jgi:hypothetical protein
MRAERIEPVFLVRARTETDPEGEQSASRFSL